MESDQSGRGRKRPSSYYDVRWGIALERQQRAVKLREGEELIISVIAERVGVSMRQVKRYLAKQRKGGARPEAGVTPRGPRSLRGRSEQQENSGEAEGDASRSSVPPGDER